MTQKSCQVNGTVVRGLSPQLQITSVIQDDNSIFLGYPLLLSWLGGLALIVLAGLLP
jgi:hypothetical protein